jgi:hypothetical protein
MSWMSGIEKVEDAASRGKRLEPFTARCKQSAAQSGLAAGEILL